METPFLQQTRKLEKQEQNKKETLIYSQFYVFYDNAFMLFFLEIKKFYILFGDEKYIFREQYQPLE